METLEYLQIILSVFSMTTLIVVAVLYANNRKRKLRDEERLTRAELSYMRERIERQIYELNEKLHSDSNRWQDVNHLLLNTLNKDKISPSKQSINYDFFHNIGIYPEEIEVNENLVFFLTPFHNDFENEFNLVKKICDKLELRCTRGDEEFVKGNILKYILEKIMSSSVVIANLNGRNPNVYYELGIAHSLGKPVILITNEANFKEIPFDLQSNKLIIYRNENELSNSLTNALAKTIIETNKK